MLRYFRSAGYIVNKTRPSASSLDSNITNMLVCLWDWCRSHWSSNFWHISI